MEVIWTQIIKVVIENEKEKKPSCCKTKKHNKKIESKLQELMLRAYPVSFNNINDEHWTLGKNN